MGQGSIIGYEINEKTCQISFYNEKDLEPDTLEVDTENCETRGRMEKKRKDLLRSKTDLPQRDF